MTTIPDEDLAIVIDVLQAQFTGGTPTNEVLGMAIVEKLREKDRLNSAIADDDAYLNGAADERSLWEEACGLASGYWWSTEADHVIDTIKERVKEKRET